MAAATIVIDASRLLEDQEATVEVEHIQDYARACLALRMALQGGSPVTIVVRSRVVAQWLRRTAAAYGDALITLSIYTPREALKERWQVEVPAQVSDAEILQSELLAISPGTHAGQTFWDTLLGYFYGDALVSGSFPLARLVPLVLALTQPAVPGANRRPLVRRALQERLQLWAVRADSEVARTLLDRLATGVGGLRRDLAGYSVTQRYPPEIGGRILGEAWQMFRKARVDVTDLALTQEDLATFTPEIEYYLTEVREQLEGTTDLEALLAQLSGRLLGEFAAVEDLVRTHPEWLTASLLQQIDQRFQPIRETIVAPLGHLRRLLRPVLPAPPEPNWSTAQWLNWVQEQYMPYYAWLDLQKRHEEVIDNYAYQFADWFYEHFVAIKHGEDQYFAFSALYRERERIAADGAVTLVLIIDNLNFLYFDQLRRLFNGQQFSLELAAPRLSLIPTATEVGKAALIAGHGDQVDLPTNLYPELVAREWEPLLQGKHACYLPTVGSLQDLRSLDAAIYFLNYLPIDEALHEDEQRTGRSHEQAVHEYLQSLVGAVTQFTKRFRLEDKLIIYVISDHGSTRILQGTVNVLDKAFFKGIALDKHHRFIALEDAQFAACPQFTSMQCYPIDRRVFKTNHNYLAARRYYHFLDVQGSYYVHGGLTPEEVVVPFARFTRQPLEPLPLSLRLPTTQYRYAIKSTVVVEVGNPNDFDLEGVQVEFLDADAEGVLVAHLRPKQRVPVMILTVFRKGPGAGLSRTLTVRVRYSCQGRSFGPQDQQFELSMKSLMEVQDDFDL